MKDKILSMLKFGIYCSGEKISRELNVSRTAVWKYIKKLRAEGYKIESSSHKGYSITEIPDVFTETEVKKYLKNKLSDREVRFIHETDSTNEEAKRNSKMPDGSVFIAEIQNGGKGRRGRKWESQEGKGIWMSILSKPDISLADVSKISLAAGLAVCDTMREAGLDAMIKWPNDIVINKRKVCGILTELSIEKSGKNYVVTGIGINVNTMGFSQELSERATSMFLECGKKFLRAKIAASVICNYEKRCAELKTRDTESFIEDYRKMCLTLGKDVRVIGSDCEFDAYACGITSGGELIVEKEGKKIVLNSGEVSVRGIYGYI